MSWYRNLMRDKHVFVDVPLLPVCVTPDQAHNLSLVINELMTNTVKYGLRERDTAHIAVRIELDNTAVLLEFRDDGPGYLEEVLRQEQVARIVISVYLC